MVITTALEYVREYLMKRIVLVQKVASKCEGPLTPAATKIFKFKKDVESQCTVDWNGADLFRVKAACDGN